MKKDIVVHRNWVSYGERIYYRSCISNLIYIESQVKQFHTVQVSEH